MVPSVRPAKQGMLYRVFADLLAFLHLAFVGYVLLGGLLAFRWRWTAWVHVPAACWGAWIEFVGWVCPLTPLENRMRAAAGDDGYAGGFVEHYLIPLIYPGELTRDIQIGLGVLVLVVNLVIYFFVWRRTVRRRSA
jgi:hypothetical protein